MSHAYEINKKIATLLGYTVKGGYIDLSNTPDKYVIGSGGAWSICDGENMEYLPKYWESDISALELLEQEEWTLEHTTNQPYRYIVSVRGIVFGGGYSLSEAICNAFIAMNT